MKIFKNLLIVLSCLSATASVAQDYTVFQFFKDLPHTCISTSYPIPKAEKQSIIDSGFKSGRCKDLSHDSDAYFETWDVVSKDDKDGLSMALRECSGDSVQIYLYKHTNGGYMAMVVSIRGNHGQSQSFEFFRVNEQHEIVRSFSQEELRLKNPRDNELISDLQAFPKDQNRIVPLYYEKEGMISAGPWTWMEPRWEERNIINKICFEWAGDKFVKHTKRIAQ